MKKYIGTKTFSAEPAWRVDGVIYPKDGAVPRVMNREDGYKVVYEDGYESWCPKDVFEKTYRIADTYLDTIIAELSDLNSKISKLEAFRGTEEFVKLFYPIRKLLVRQHDVMVNYADILRERMGRGMCTEPMRNEIVWKDATKVLPKNDTLCLVHTRQGIKLCRLTNNACGEGVWYNEYWKSYVNSGEVTAWADVSHF